MNKFIELLDFTPPQYVIDISMYSRVQFLAIIIRYPTMKRSLKATIMAALGITTFASVSMTSVKINQPIATIPVQSSNLNTNIASTTTGYYNLQEPSINASVSSNKSYLSPHISSSTSYTTLFQSPISEPSKPFQLSFGGEVAEARAPKTKVPIRMPDGKDILVFADNASKVWGIVDMLRGIWGAFGGNSDNVYFAVANEVPMEWGEAWGYCNRQYNAKLVWQNNLKTCVKR
jgi:hypothetical protein